MDKIMDVIINSAIGNSIPIAILLIIFKNFAVKMFNRINMIEDKQSATIKGLSNGDFKKSYEEELHRLYEERDRKNNNKIL